MESKKSYSEILISTYNRLEEFTEEVRDNGYISELKLTDLQRIFNTIVPRDDGDRDFISTFRSLYDISTNRKKGKHNKSHHEKIVSGENKHMILLFDGYTISKHFGINNMVYIGWDEKNESYTISKWTGKYTSDNRNSPRSPGGKITTIKPIANTESIHLKLDEIIRNIEKLRKQQQEIVEYLLNGKNKEKSEEKTQDWGDMEEIKSLNS
jgi:hypothetical protein